MPPESKQIVGWRDLPKKKQLFVITMARLSEPLVQTSLQSYMFYQLKWFDPSQPDAIISGQAGVLHASFTAAQFLTAMVWGRVADSKRAGRKSVILVGLIGTCKLKGGRVSFAVVSNSVVQLCPASGLASPLVSGRPSSSDFSVA